MYILKKQKKLKICIVGILLLIIIFGSASIVYCNTHEKLKEQQEFSSEKDDIRTITIAGENNEDKKNSDIVINDVDESQGQYKINESFKENWFIEIPKVNLLAPISEGTTQEVMSEYVGHFENTEAWNGNIGLAAHNRRMSSKLF